MPNASCNDKVVGQGKDKVTVRKTNRKASVPSTVGVYKIKRLVSLPSLTMDILAPLPQLWLWYNRTMSSMLKPVWFVWHWHLGF